MPDPKIETDSRGAAVLLGLNNLGRHIYAGTVPAVTVARRRKANRAARASRRMNRSAR